MLPLDLALPNGAATSYSYDADGNLTSNGTDTYVWNARNQLAQIKQGTSMIASFSYDPLGRRVDTNLNGATTGYLYDGLNAVQETHGSTATSILSGLAVDERFARTDTSGRTDFLTDALNSTIGLTNSSGALVEQYTYDPYGNTTASSSAFNNPFQYTGRENDGTGLYFYRARYYAPGMGRFISEDPMGFSGRQLDFYAYVEENPLSGGDPLGLEGPEYALYSGGITNQIDAANEMTAFGFALTFSSVNPFTSGGGGVYGLNLEFTKDAGWHLYKFNTPNECSSAGFNPGASLTMNVAVGSGPWTGPFIQTDASAAIFAAGFFQTPSAGYFGWQGGISAPTPVGLSQAQANYTVIW